MNSDTPQATANDPLRSWVDRLRELVDIARRPLDGFYRLGDAPGAAEPESALPLLAEAWLGVLGERRPDVLVGDITDVLGEHHASEAQRAVLPVLRGLERRISGEFERLGTEFPNVGLIPVAPFTTRGFFQSSAINGKTLLLLTAPLSNLPEGHWIRSLLPADGWHQQGWGPTLSFGPATIDLFGNPVPRPFYPLAGVLNLTRSFRAAQRQKEEAERRELDLAALRAPKPQTPEELEIGRLRAELDQLKAVVSGRTGG